jgi:glutaryl-CoA dehydrogenase (non-decarboxylating)
MNFELTKEQKKWAEQAYNFTNQYIIHEAHHWDQNEMIPDTIFSLLGKLGYLGALIPSKYGGLEMDIISFGLINEELGRGCSSTRCLLTVQTMVALAIVKWGSQELRDYWLPLLASGEVLGSFALTEPEFGSDAAKHQTTATKDKEHYLLNGVKTWITFGTKADLFLVFASIDNKSTAFVVPANTPNLTIESISGMLGCRAANLAKLTFIDCPIHQENMLARPGFGFSHVGNVALNNGRLSIAWGCVGILRACIDSSMVYAHKRKQFGKQLKSHQLIQEMLTNMITNYRAAKLLCFEASHLANKHNHRSIYFDS